MIKYDRNEFLRPQIYSTNDSYETRYIVNNEITDDIKQLQQENQKYKETFDKAIKYIEKHTNNNTEYLDVWEVREILDILKEAE